MAEAQGDKNTAPQRRPPHQFRTTYSNRGRGRPDPHVSKALYNFGVTDLREWLDKKHQQQGQSKSSAPPPDPSYNYLKDPSREYEYDSQTRKYQKERGERAGDSWSRGHAPRGSRGRGGGINRADRRLENEKASYIQNPVNIKIELKTATGERSCILDEETKLADIKHVPDRKQQERRFFRGEKGRGRDESGRNRGFQNEGAGDKNENERGRGERGRGWRGRGRGPRRGGRGRWEGRYNPNANNIKQVESNLTQNIIVAEVPTEEDWDNECVTPPAEQNTTENVENTLERYGNLEETYTQNQEGYYGGDYEELHEDYEEGEEEYLEATGDGYVEYVDIVGENRPLEEEKETEIPLEENLVITSTVLQQHEESGKRIVRFKLDDDEEYEENANKKQTQAEEKLKQENPLESETVQIKPSTEDKHLVLQDVLEDGKAKSEGQLPRKGTLESKTVEEKDVTLNKSGSELQKSMNVKEAAKDNAENANEEK